MQGPGRRTTRVARCLMVAAPMCLATAVIAPAAEGFVACSSADGVLGVSMTERGDQARIVRNGDAIAVVVSLSEFEDEGGPSVSVGCTGPLPTVANTDLIKVDEAPAAVQTELEIDLSGGVLAPGATSEADGTSEIEVRANMSGAFGRVDISGTRGPDIIDFGANAAGGFGANLNGAFETAPDADIELNGVEVPTVTGKGGPDVIRASGAAGFTGPLRGTGFAVAAGAGRDLIVGAAATNLLSGGDGDDRVFGGPRSDYLIGGRGSDRLGSKAASDFIAAKERGGDRDVVSCGSGRDYPATNKEDRRSGCEKLPADDRKLPDKVVKRIIKVLIVAEDVLFS